MLVQQLRTITELTCHIATMAEELNIIANALDTEADAIAKRAHLPVEAYHPAFTKQD